MEQLQSRTVAVSMKGYCQDGRDEALKGGGDMLTAAYHSLQYNTVGI